MAVWMVLSNKKGISSLQLAGDIKVTQKTAWYVLQRIRICLVCENKGKLHGEVEADETFVGGKIRIGIMTRKLKLAKDVHSRIRPRFWEWLKEKERLLGELSRIRPKRNLLLKYWSLLIETLYCTLTNGTDIMI